VLPLPVLVAAFALVLGALTGRQAEAATCAADVHIKGSVVAVELDPSSVTVRKGKCVSFTNDLGVPVDVHVDPGYDQQVPPGGAVSYPAKRVGAHDMSAGTLVSQDTGRVTVRRAPQPTQSATSTPPPTTPPASSPASEPPKPRNTGSGPRVAPTPSFSSFPAPATSSPVGSRPSVAPTSAGAFPTAPQPTTSASVAVAGPIEPASGRGTGLPAAVAALSIVGAGAGLVRVLLAEPVDDLPAVGGRP
jgi:hypothetical protein